MQMYMCDGRLGADPKCTVKGGLSRANFSIAVKSNHSDKIHWIDCVIFGPVVEKLIKPFVKKGTKVMIAGELNANVYEMSDGKKNKDICVKIDTISILESKNNPEGNTESQPTETTPLENSVDSISSDNLPF